ncbi:hypothetical protein O181_076783 [Austropuccinia psidii MF-1]|uniref:Uncharacterized protein n=1 Tax=Austropuccinia psidii MF-1 TaxID=1389203 RepID=A0A9Q3ID42_9BASI|nr:hypothetical protein [Austropuccinia psidii MF-1]
MEYKDQEGYNHEWGTLLPEVQLAYNKSKDSPKGKLPSRVEGWWSPLFPMDHLKKSLLTCHPTAKDFHYMWKKACETAAKCMDEAKEYKKQGYDKTHMEPHFKKGNQFFEP